MTLPKVHVCGYCGKAFKMEATKRLPAGEHLARIDVSKTPCPACREKFDAGRVSQDDTQARENSSEESKGC